MIHILKENSSSDEYLPAMYNIRWKKLEKLEN